MIGYVPVCRPVKRVTINVRDSVNEGVLDKKAVYARGSHNAHVLSTSMRLSVTTTLRTGTRNLAGFWGPVGTPSHPEVCFN